eukprot:gnl/MRDRNA2_/MRDRNA2_81310_c0_seq1.p1 gnl/MRDRNA2_/MRDRNA2_81310_c0~~gnl/MRDRNA2_/MRDRNA2_81310_c0_seq1.p1  ORF type:complete len:181 (-),score=14.92 gnl/MRDRNA2_/MRDRNA2_81310_c0_seq1:149-691(-)
MKFVGASVGEEDLAMTSWAFSVCVMTNAPLLEALAAPARRRISASVEHLRALSLSLTKWAMSVAVSRDDPVFMASWYVGLQVACQFSRQDRTSTAWAFAQIVFLDEPLLHAIAASAIRRFAFAALFNYLQEDHVLVPLWKLSFVDVHGSLLESVAQPCMDQDITDFAFSSTPRFTKKMLC